MAAPKGNKNAIGHGRPPNPGYTDSDLIKLGEEFLSWMKMVDKQNLEVVHLSEWYSEIKGIPRSQWISICERSCFLDYYEKAREWMGKKILKNRDLPTAYGSRFLGIYYKEVDDHEFEKEKRKIDYELQRKALIDAQKGIPPNDSILTDMLNEIKKLNGK